MYSYYLSAIEEIEKQYPTKEKRIPLSTTSSATPTRSSAPSSSIQHNKKHLGVDENQNQSTKKDVPCDFEEFKNLVMTKFALKSSLQMNSNKHMYDALWEKVDTHGKNKQKNSTCTICSNDVILNAQIIRRCLCESQYPCYQNCCHCSEKNENKMHPCCLDCLLHHLWTSSTSSMKDMGRFRAKCPLCKCEYCPYDIVTF